MLKKNQIQNIENSVKIFISWLDRNGWESFDQFDFWASKSGVFSKKLFLKKKWLAAPLVLLFQMLESFAPGTRIVLAKKQRFAIGDAHLALGFLNLYKYFQNEAFLNRAEEIIKVLIESKTKTDSGIGWGYPYTWITRRAEYPPYTPFITVTPYCFDAILKLYEITKEKKNLELLQQIALFAANDLRETKVSEGVYAAGYGPGDTSGVINANSYRAALLLKAFDLFGNIEYKEKAILNLNYVLQEQQGDGSWDYAPNEHFIDNFHTCFVLKNIYKSYTILEDPDLLKSLKKGYEYYRKFLFRSDNTPLHFSKISNPKFRKIEMYDYAEGISLGVLLNKTIPGAKDFSVRLAEDLIKKFQLKKGYFITRVSTLNTKNKIPYLRWPQAQLFYSLTELLVNVSKDFGEGKK